MREEGNDSSSSRSSRNRNKNKTMMMRENDGLVCFPPELIEMLWGSSTNVASIFDRWSQAFEFSRDENSALIQLEGGPCSVLTPVQAHLLEQLIFSSRHRSNWRQASQDEVDLHFLNALISILDLLCPPNETIFLPDASLLADQRQQLTMEDFHRRLTFRSFRSRVTWKKEIFSRLSMWKQPFGILLFLYSCLMTKTFQRLKQEIDDETSLPLIDSQHGHGSQALTNLLITGSATPHCFDGEKDISGLKLKGIEKQASIGFLSTLESYRLMEVGWFLKNPRTPIWILASETHLTVFFSPEKSLVQLDQQTPKQQAQTIFHKYDTEKNGFISVDLLEQVMEEMFTKKLIKKTLTPADWKRKLDPDGLQIVTESVFFQEFFPSEKNSFDDPNGLCQGKIFPIYHYNGLLRSNQDNQLKYLQGQATIDDFSYQNQSSKSQLQPGSYLPITGVLRTKWSTIELRWEDNVKPSLN